MTMPVDVNFDVDDDVVVDNVDVDDHVGYHVVDVIDEH